MANEIERDLSKIDGPLGDFVRNEIETKRLKKEREKKFEDSLKLPQHIVDFWGKAMKDQVIITNIKDEHDYTMDCSEKIVKKKTIRETYI